MRDSREKGAGMRDQDPPFQTLNTDVRFFFQAWQCLDARQPRMDRGSRVNAL